MINVFSNPYRPNGNPIPRSSKPAPVEVASDVLTEEDISRVRELLRLDPRGELRDKSTGARRWTDKIVIGLLAKHTTQDAENKELRGLLQEAFDDWPDCDTESVDVVIERWYKRTAVALKVSKKPANDEREPKEREEGA